jgi:hypothetical protein
MPQVVVLALVGTAALLGYKYLKRVAEADAALRHAEALAKPMRLERGSDGVYRPVMR